MKPHASDTASKLTNLLLILAAVTSRIPRRFVVVVDLFPFVALVRGSSLSGWQVGSYATTLQASKQAVNGAGRNQQNRQGRTDIGTRATFQSIATSRPLSRAYKSRRRSCHHLCRPRHADLSQRAWGLGLV